MCCISLEVELVGLAGKVMSSTILDSLKDPRYCWSSGFYSFEGGARSSMSFDLHFYLVCCTEVTVTLLDKE